MSIRIYSILFGKYVLAGLIGYPFELAAIYAITEYLHVWYLVSAALSLAAAFLVYFVADVLFGVIKPTTDSAHDGGGA